MQFKLATVIAALPFLVSASPLDTATLDNTPRSLPSGMKVPMHRRADHFTGEDGTVNTAVLQDQIKNSLLKMQRGFEAYQRNTGKRHPLDMSNLLHARKIGVDALTDYSNVLWYGAIQVGTPPQNYTVDFDTGSSDLFLPGPNCKTNCAGHKAYNPSQSSTSKDVHQTFQLAYGDGSTVQGEQYSDTVQLSGLTATSQRLGAANQYSTGFNKNQFPPDGLLGMGFQSISQYNSPPPFQSFAQQKQVDQPVFTFRLTANAGSQLEVGSSSIAGNAVTYTKGYWQVNMDNVLVNGKRAVGQLSVIIDSGTTLVIGDSKSVKMLYAAVPGSKDASRTVGQGYYTVPCSAIPTISLTFSGKSFPISPSIFNLGRVSRGSNDCVGGVVSSDIAQNFWIVGDIFLRNVYAVFDYGNVQVGFSQAS
ncbi:acid protease [Gloeophyllum trabeum ATCC 11539]|uniref:Acid protease n=1 Tax=Gloeophyllum trabeum (strain ATCC 11539 / FP-39264 / Madison 617) TaxID=670483 RepID=S7Q9D4_GLOTA|nr:acid protease [Gloeophyllum trabeum ATCC 11539]EPQ56531.1 acid protease [Gloeophyllum trabeum ATCC 11539]